MLIYRFIPTCVGSAKEVPGTFVTSSVHPHVCGERVDIIHILGYFIGSSPRVWGARATVSPDTVSSPVHPHVCGERFFSKRRARR